MAVAYEHVRREFYTAYQADGETEQGRMDAKRAAFNRQAKDAQARNLLVTRDTGDAIVAWSVADA